jgi:acyl-CoA thioesterase-1
MNRRFFLSLLLATTAFAQDKKPDPAMTPVTDEPGLPRVLLIGDSISIGYTVGTRGLLRGKANVHRILTNGESTVTGLAKLDAWLGTGKWDVIHFNWGLHDLKQYKDGKLTPGAPVWVEVADYEKNLGTLVERLKKTGAKLIFATTTPVPEGANGRVPGLEKTYNEAALRVMKSAGVAINDLHAHCLPNLATWQRPKDVHFTPIGCTKLAEKVAAEIAIALAGAK